MKQLKHLVTAVATLLISTSAHAQFITSTIAEIFAGTTVNPTKTTNDSKFYTATVGGPYDLMNAIAWDGTTPKIYWYKYGGGPSATIPLPSGANHPDLVISSDMNYMNMYLLVAYIDASGFNLRAYKWTGATFSLSNVTNWIDVPGTYTPSINIDATGNGDYAVVIGYSDGSIEVYNDINANLPLSPTNSGSLPAGTGHQTDVCVNSTMGGTTNVHISYTNFANSALYTRDAAFSTLIFSTPTIIASAVGSTTYADPRIASSNINAPGCPGTDIFSVIYDEITASVYNIHLYSVESSGTYNVILNNATAGFPPLALPLSKRPVVTYDEAWSFPSPSCSANIVTAWNSGTSSRSIVGEKLLSNGAVWGAARYYDINNPVRPTCDLVSISSKYAGDRVFISFYDGSGGGMVRYKYLGYGDPTMRTTHNNTISGMYQSKDFAVYPNPASGNIVLDFSGFGVDAVLDIRVTDAMGRNSYTSKGAPVTLQEQASGWSSQLAPGIYFLQCSDAEGFSKTLKIVKQ